MRHLKQQSFGPNIAVYRDKPLRWRDLFTIFIPGSLAILFLVGYGLWRSYYGHVRYGPVAGEAWGSPWIELATLALIPLLLLALIRVRRAHRMVAIHKRGIRIRGIGKHDLLWEEIEGITSATIKTSTIGLVNQIRYHTRIHPSNGRPIHLDNRIRNLPELTTRLKAFLYPRLLPRLRTAFRNEEYIHFDSLSLHRQCLIYRSQRYPWDQVTRLTIQSGYLVVDLKNSNPIHLPVIRIPNIELLLQLVQEEVIV